MKIEVECCEGKPTYRGQCLKDKCPIYERARTAIYRGWPHEQTGFGNLYGNPTEAHYLAKVQDILQSERASVRNDSNEVSTKPESQ